MSAVLNSHNQPLTLCTYKNKTQKVQIGKIFDTAQKNSETVILPGETFVFKISPNAHLAIYTNIAGKTKLIDSMTYSSLHSPNVMAS